MIILATKHQCQFLTVRYEEFGSRHAKTLLTTAKRRVVVSWLDLMTLQKMTLASSAASTPISLGRARPWRSWTSVGEATLIAFIEVVGIEAGDDANTKMQIRLRGSPPSGRKVWRAHHKILDS